MVDILTSSQVGKIPLNDLTRAETVLLEGPGDAQTNHRELHNSRQWIPSSSEPS